MTLFVPRTTTVICYGQQRQGYHSAQCTVAMDDGWEHALGLGVDGRNTSYAMHSA